ncbi:MAG: hypothetical protein IKU42_08550 [Oscillospiraceae bacterium]|nr:hypothetical protein [Oscillospiraceae bacterium]
MKEYKIRIDDAAAKFYETIARRTETKPERVMAETLFKVAGELSLKAVLDNQNP